ncbi:MAG TPA: DUF5995 family protein, partial [Solirubrobacteraceae bacterium]
QYTDYVAVNRLLATVERQAKASYMTGWIARLDRVLHRVHRIDDVIAMWDVEKARAAAWTNGEALWALRDEALLSGRELRQATRGAIFVQHSHTPTLDVKVRLLGTPVTVQGRRLVVVVGTSLEPSEDALQRLGGLLLVGFPVALLLASLAGYGAATGALRPVEAMRRRAREIHADRQGQRLPVPEADDEVRRLGETLNEMLARIEAAFARERRFVADASHELRTPLAILRGELELALRDAGDVEDFRESVSSAAEEADRLSQLAEDLLVIARADQGSLPVRREDIDATGLLGGLEQRFAQRAGAHGVEVEARRPSEPVHLIADVLRMEQALGNLVDNALRHGGGTVELVAHTRGDTVHLHVLDDGPGFPDDFLPGAFERFTRGDPARGRGGAGLGLAIVQAIAEAHGGRARARNRPEGGADVWLELPHARAPAAAAVPG